MKKYKYLVLDFGKVIAGPTTGNWDITPKFQELIDMNKFDIDKFKEIRPKYGHILSEKLTTLEDEYNMFYRFYQGILSEMNIDDEIIKEIAKDRTYKNDKYTLYEGIHKELDKLKNKYILLLLTDNWPCAYNYLKDNKLYDYFDKVYISALYGEEKRDKVFFDRPIKDYNIKKGEALFIDDNELNLDNATEKGFDCLLMDREHSVESSKYKIIHDLTI